MKCYTVLTFGDTSGIISHCLNVENYDTGIVMRIWKLLSLSNRRDGNWVSKILGKSFNSTIP